MSSVPQKMLRASAAATMGAAWYITLCIVAVGICLVALHQATIWTETGTLPFTSTPAPAAEHPGDVPVTGASPSEARTVNAALATLRYRPPTGAVSYDITSDLGPQYEGEFISGVNVIHVGRSVARRAGPELRRTLAHEIGHYVDANMLTELQRARFYKLRQIPMRRPWAGGGQPWEKTPSEDFAEVFASIDIPTADGNPITAYGPITRRAEFEKLFRDAGVTFGRRQPRPPVRFVAHRELGYVARVVTRPTSRRLVWIGVVVFGLSGALTYGARAWRRDPFI